MELCDGSPPHFNVHPMRAIFIISSKPAPILKDQDRWSKDLHHFLSQCLVKDCEKRASAADLLAHPWIQKAVKEIGPNGRCSPILANLVNENWDEIEKIRVARFKLPENIPVGGENCAAAVDPEQSAIDEDNTATMRVRTARSNNSSGIPATRQQIRNLTLTRSMTPSSRYRGAVEDQEDFSSTLIRRPLPPVQAQDGTFVRAPAVSSADHKHLSPDRPQGKGSYQLPHNHDGTFVRAEPRRRTSGMQDMDRDGTLVVHDGNSYSGIAGSKIVDQDEEEGDNNGTFARRRTSGSKNDDRSDLQAALRYFREESSGAVNANTAPTSTPPHKPPIVPSAEPKEKPTPLRLSTKDVRDREDEEVYRTYDSKEVVLSPSNRTDSELEILNTLTVAGADSDPMKELLKKVCMPCAIVVAMMILETNRRSLFI